MASLFDQFDVLGAMWMTIKLTAISAVLALVLGTIALALSPVIPPRTTDPRHAPRAVTA